jgi:hypothetical protein
MPAGFRDRPVRPSRDRTARLAAQQPGPEEPDRGRPSPRRLAGAALRGRPTAAAQGATVLVGALPAGGLGPPPGRASAPVRCRARPGAPVRGPTRHALRAAGAWRARVPAPRLRRWAITVPEVAAALHKTTGAVKALQHRALANLARRQRRSSRDHPDATAALRAAPWPRPPSHGSADTHCPEEEPPTHGARAEGFLRGGRVEAAASITDAVRQRTEGGRSTARASSRRAVQQITTRLVPHQPNRCPVVVRSRAADDMACWVGDRTEVSIAASGTPHHIDGCGHQEAHAH